MSKYNYIITSGWWCTNDENTKDRSIKYGDEFIRTDNFHRLWSNAIKKYCRPIKTYIIDSNSPVKPILNESEILISLHENAGHPTLHIGKLSGVSRAHMLGMSIALANEVDYWVYIEQDALVFGHNIIEKCIENMRGPYMFGSGDGTPQPVQHALMIIRADGIPKFIKNFNSIKAKDFEISPEKKFAIATSFILRMFPEWFFIIANKPHFAGRIAKKINSIIFRIFQGFENIPFGYGRKRPINFDEQYFYFQHGSKKELEMYKMKSLN